MRISYSLLENFKQCPLKYKFRTVDKIKPAEKVEFWFGNLIHAILFSALKNEPILPTTEQLIEKMKQNWRQDLFKNERDSQNYFLTGEKMLKDFLAHYKPGLSNIVSLEKRFVLPFGEHQISGMIDRIDKLPFGAFQIIDYKTSKSLKTKEELDKDNQLTLYHWATQLLWPEVKEIKLTLHFLKHNEKVSTFRTKEHIEEFLQGVSKTISEIENSILENKFPPKVSNLCNYCEYGHICPMQKQKNAQKSKKDEKIRTFRSSSQRSCSLRASSQRSCSLRAAQEPCFSREAQKIETIINEYILNHQRQKELEEKIHQHFDKAKIERFFHPKGILTRRKRKFFIRKSDNFLL